VTIINRDGWGIKQQRRVTVLSEERAQQPKTAKVVQLEKVVDNLDWLERSLTCISSIPRDVEDLSRRINNAFSERILIRDLGKFKFLLTLESKEAKEKLRNEGEECLKEWFSSINDWAEEDVCQTRRLWLEIVGVPIHLWSEINIRKIAENWGDVVFVEEETSTKKSFAAAKVVIDSMCLSPIEDEAILQVGNKGFRISVFEAKTAYTIIHTGPLEEEDSSSSMKAQGMEVRGLNDEVAQEADLEQVERQQEMSQDAVHVAQEGQQLPNGLLNLNSNLSSANYEGQQLPHEEGGTRMFLNGTVNTSLADKNGNEALVGNEGGEKLMKLGVGINDVNAMIIRNDNQDHKVGSPVEVNSEEGCRGSPQINIGKCSIVAPASRNSEDEAFRVEKSDRLENGASICLSSRSRTKTAQVSGNGYSEEVAKLYQIGLPDAREVENGSRSAFGDFNMDVPPGFSPIVGCEGWWGVSQAADW